MGFWYWQSCGSILFLNKNEITAPISEEAVCTSWPKLVISNCLFNEYHCTWNILHPGCLNKRLTIIIMCDVTIITISLSAHWFYKQRILISWFDQAGNGRRSVRGGEEQRQSYLDAGFSSESMTGEIGGRCTKHNCKRTLSFYTNAGFE